MPPFGPIYCETPAYIGPGFPAEPWNTYSNLVIIYFGIASAVLVARRAPRAYDLYLLCALLLLNGVGSFLWHGLRTRWALTFDVFPALIFLLCVLFLWARRISPLWQSLLVLGGFFAIQSAQRYAGIDLRGIGIWVAVAPAVILVGLWLIVRTIAISKPAALYGGLSLGFAIAGLGFRVADRAVCANVPFGTHFLWHILLSTAAFLGMRALVVLTAAKAARAPAAAVAAEAPAE